MKLSRQLTDVERLQSQARQALVLADKERAGGNEAKAQEFEQSAQAFANQLVSSEQSVEDLKSMHDQSLQAAEAAKKAVEQNSSMLQAKLAERTQLLSQLEQAKMQERVSASLQSVSEMAAPGNVPSLSEVREKIESRYATALGQAELANNSVQGRMLEVQKSTVDFAGAARLEQIRASIGGGSSATQAISGSSTPAVEAGNGSQAAGTTPAGETVTNPQSTNPQSTTTPQPADPA
jgi:phage shock protein A